MDKSSVARLIGRRRRGVHLTLGLLVTLLPVRSGAPPVAQAYVKREQNHGQYQGLRGGGADVSGKGAEHERQLPVISIGELGQDFDAEEQWRDYGSEETYFTEEADIATPPRWDSTLCMHHWGVPNYQRTLDPHGYIIYVNGREQLGGNRYLVSDGIFIAKSLTRSMIEYPVMDSRVSAGDSKLGLGAYWDLSELCMYHRILDLHTFRSFVSSGLIKSTDIVTIGNADGHEHPTSRLITEKDVKIFFEQYSEYKVIVMEGTWKSSIARDALSYLRPNPFYMGVVRMLLESQKDWMNGNYLALQWRTETSTGNLTECYDAVKHVVERHRTALGLGRHQVFVNTDLIGETSGTYKANKQAARHEALDFIMRDYPESLDNNLHRFIAKLEDTGVKAFVSGLAVASSRVMIASSLNLPETKALPEANVCQKPYSGYITLIAEWREDIVKKEANSTIRLFPFEV